MRAQPMLPLHPIPGEAQRGVPLSDVCQAGVGPGDLPGMLMVIVVLLCWWLRPVCGRVMFWTRVLRVLLR